MTPHFRVGEVEFREMKSLFLSCTANEPQSQASSPSALLLPLDNVLRTDEFPEKRRMDGEEKRVITEIQVVAQL